MSSPSPAIPGETVGAASLRVGLTRAASSFGSELAALLGLGGVQVVGLDRHAGSLAGVEWRPGDIAAPSVVGALDDVDVLVHLAGEPDLGSALAEQPAVRRTRQLDQVRTLTTAAAAAGVSRLLVVTSTMVHGARADNPVPIPEDSPLRSTDPEGLVSDLVAAEAELAAVAALHPRLQVVVVRPAALVGPGVDTMITRHFEAPRLLTLRDTHPAWSFCHVEDLASALLLLARGEDRGRARGQVAVSAPGFLTQTEVEVVTGMRHIELSQVAAFSAAERLHRLGVVPVPATDLAFIAHPWSVEPERLLASGWRPVHDNASCLRTLLEGAHGNHALMSRRVRSRDALGAAAAATAASAAVAGVATAALMRRRRDRG